MFIHVGRYTFEKVVFCCSVLCLLPILIIIHLQRSSWRCSKAICKVCRRKSFLLQNAPGCSSCFNFFYNGGIVTHIRRIGSRGRRIGSWCTIMLRLQNFIFLFVLTNLYEKNAANPRVQRQTII
jgi:hypothetical protein